MNTHKRVAIAVLGGLAIAGVAGASAATLGGVRSSSVGSDDGIITSCDSDGVDVSYDTAFQGGAYKVTAVTFSDVSKDCDGDEASFTLLDGGNAALTSQSAVATATEFTVSLNTPVSAEALAGISLVIEG